MEGHIVVARVDEDAALVLAPTAAALWAELAGWRTAEDLVRALGRRWPEVDEADRRATVTEVVDLLDGEGLLERRRP